MRDKKMKAMCECCEEYITTNKFYAYRGKIYCSYDCIKENCDSCKDFDINLAYEIDINDLNDYGELKEDE